MAPPPGSLTWAIYPYPSAIIVSNDTLPYVWNGGAITTPLLKKNGPGSLTRVGGEADLITEHRAERRLVCGQQHL